MPAIRALLVVAVGAFTGLLGGLFGKGGSAIATPLLHAVGVSSYAAVASPLPATIPSTLIAALAFSRAGWIDRRVLQATVAVGVPATVVGALTTIWVGGSVLVLAADVVVALIGVRMLARDRHRSVAAPEPVAALVMSGPPRSDAPPPADASRTTLLVVGVGVGLAAGLLGNSGGFLLAPLYLTVLRMPLKAALGTSLAAAAVLAVPGTVVHAALGHIDWSVTALFGLASIPLAAVGARIALRTSAHRLELLYGAALVLLGGGLLLVH